MWFLLWFFASLLAGIGNSDDDGRRVYVVYMGAVPPHTSPDLLRESHLRLVGTVLKRSPASSSYISIGR
jgi:hypothetical protein